jgi:hypothetical protein
MSDFNSLIAKYQKHQTPIFDLTPEQIELVGVSLKNTLKAQETFQKAFSRMVLLWRV